MPRRPLKSPSWPGSAPSGPKAPSAWWQSAEYDGLITTILAELDADKRATLIHDMAQKLHEQYHGVMLG